MPKSELPCVLAIDPGRSKAGLAVVRCDGAVLYRTVLAVSELGACVERVYQQFHPERMVVGGGTGFRLLEPLLHDVLPDLPAEVVDESYTSEQARRRYLQENPPKGWRRLIPHWLRTPEEPYDDYVAIILAERYWQSHGGC